MDRSTLAFVSVFPVLSLSHTTPTPIATPDLGHVASNGSFGSPVVDRASNASGQEQHRALKRSLAWSCATRFLSLPKDLTPGSRLHRTREVNEALTYLLAREGKNQDKEESLIDWYSNECRLHFTNMVRPELEQRWSVEIQLKYAWEVLDETQCTLEHIQRAYLQSFNDHILPFLQHDAKKTSLQSGRPAQSIDTSLATSVSCKFQRDLHATFVHCLPQQRFSKTLSYVLYDAGCRLFRIHTRHGGTYLSMPPENNKLFRQRMTKLLQDLERVGLGGDCAQKAFAHAMHKLLDSFVASHYLKVDWYSRTSVVPHLKMWIQDGFCPLAELVLTCLQCEQSGISPAELSSWQEMALSRLGRARVDNLFDFIVNWDSSSGAILDIKEYLKLAGAKQFLTSVFSQQVSRRLLQPGATTTYILDVYIFIIRCFYQLEPKGVLLERVARPIRRYLKERDDTARIIISSLLADPNDRLGTKISSGGELSYEIASEMTKPMAYHGPETDEETNWNDMNWQPLPQDASPDYKKSRAEDVIWFLLTLWEREDFIDEFKNLLGNHLLRCQDPEFEREIKLLELIKGRLGDDKMQACEVMLRDVLDSRHINSAIRAAVDAPAFAAAPVTPDHRNGEHQALRALHPQTPQPRRQITRSASHLTSSTLGPVPSTRSVLKARILSSFFWPPLRDDVFRVPASIDALQKAYESDFERIKGMRKLRWMNALGEGTITLEFADRAEEFEHVTSWQISVVCAFLPQQGEEYLAEKHVTEGGEGIARSIEQLESMLEMDQALVCQALAFWVGKSVLREISPTTYAIIERLPSKTSQAQADEDAAAAAEEVAAVQAAEASALKSQTDLLNEKKEIYTLFIIGMLTNQGNLPVQRIAMMMRMMVQGGFPFGVDEVKSLLAELEADNKVSSLGGDVWGIKK